MARLLENYGLDFLYEQDESIVGLLGFAAREGKVKNGYYGTPYIWQSMGDFEVWLKTEKNEDGNLHVSSFDTHCSGSCVWKMRCAGIDVTPLNVSRLQRTLVFKGTTEKDGLIPIDVINADILPSFLEDDVIEMQLIALPLEINYYKNEQEYEAAQPKNKNGEKWIAAMGTLFPISFLVNHSPDRYDADKRYESDAFVNFTATAKELYHGTIDIGGEKMNTFIRCMAETDFGILEFNHTIDQVPEHMREHIEVGSIISGVCVLSGDVAIHEYGNGIVKDDEHNLRLLRYTLEKGEPERLTSVLTNDAICESDCSRSRFVGQSEIVNHIKSVHNASNSKYIAKLATIVASDNGAEYPVGTRCIVLWEHENDNCEAIVFLTHDDQGMVVKIKFDASKQYRFEIDE